MVGLYQCGRPSVVLCCAVLCCSGLGYVCMYVCGFGGGRKRKSECGWTDRELSSQVVERETVGCPSVWLAVCLCVLAPGGYGQSSLIAVLR